MSAPKKDFGSVTMKSEPPPKPITAEPGDTVVIGAPIKQPMVVFGNDGTIVFREDFDEKVCEMLEKTKDPVTGLGLHMAIHIRRLQRQVETMQMVIDALALRQPAEPVAEGVQQA